MIIRFYTAGRAIMAEREHGETYIVCVFEFDDSKPGQSYQNALDNAVLVADLLNKNFAQPESINIGGKLHLTVNGMQKLVKQEKEKTK